MTPETRVLAIRLALSLTGLEFFGPARRDAGASHALNPESRRSTSTCPVCSSASATHRTRRPRSRATSRPRERPAIACPTPWIGTRGAGRSLLDEVPLDGFLLVAGPAGAAWTQAARAVASPRLAALRLDAQAMPDLQRWLEQAGIGPSGPLLVRPDQHVAWRARDEAARDGLADALAAALAGRAPADEPTIQ